MESLLELRLERPVAGGRMLARHDGQVVLVAGAIAGEVVRARIARTSRHTLFADVVDVLEPSPFRRPVSGDSRCGGLSYAHITPAQQCVLKGAVIADALRRLGGIATEDPRVDGGAHEEYGYRLRARLHVRDRRAGFFLEGTHHLCDASATGQLMPEALASVGALLTDLGPGADACEAITIAENVPATERVLHLERRAGATPADLGTRELRDRPDGVTTARGHRLLSLAGPTHVVDTAVALFLGRSPIPDRVTWIRSGASFFQGNRYMTGPLAAHVLDVAAGTTVLDLYAGVGLFAVALASRGARVTAVEGDPFASSDLALNVDRNAANVIVHRASVESVVAGLAPGSVETVVLDPPRTGTTPDALAATLALRAPRLVYVSCDPPTLARDARRIVTAGYALTSVRGFDLFPNTPHVETVAVFDSAGGSG
jgi:23S rRNA (uracil1939-C5)-methyltransferase